MSFFWVFLFLPQISMEIIENNKENNKKWPWIFPIIYITDYLYLISPYLSIIITVICYRILRFHLTFGPKNTFKMQTIYMIRIHHNLSKINLHCSNIRYSISYSINSYAPNKLMFIKILFFRPLNF